MRRSLLLLSLFVCVAGAVVAQTTAFTYQGRLTNAGAAATGAFDFTFKLYSAASGGTANAGAANGGAANAVKCISLALTCWS